MGNGVAGVVSNVEYQSITSTSSRRTQPLALSDFGRRRKEVGQKFTVSSVEVIGIGHVASGYYEHVGWRLGIDVAEGEAVLCGKHLVNRHVTGDDLAEQTVLGHGALRY